MHKSIISLIDEQNLEELKKILKKDESLLYVRDNQGNNVLHYIAPMTGGKALEIVQLLLSYELDPEMLNKSFKSAIEIAEENNNIPVFKMMESFVNMKKQQEKNYS